MSTTKQQRNQSDRSNVFSDDGGQQHLRLRVNSTSSATKQQPQQRRSNLQTRSSSQELVELEEQQRSIAQLMQQSYHTNNNNNEERLEDLAKERYTWKENYGNSSSSDEDDDDNGNPDDDDDDEDDALYASDSDDSSVSGRKNRSSSDDRSGGNSSDCVDDVTCGVIEDTLLQLTLSTEETKSLQKEVSVDSSLISELDDSSEDNDVYSPKIKKPIHNKKRRFFSRFRRRPPKDTVPAVFDFEQYMLKREMNVTQEKWNAITVLPNPAYCLYFLLSAQWLTQMTTNEVLFTKNESIGIDNMDGCLQHTSWHSMPALPPLPVIAVALGIIIHAPWSFLYHWTYAHTMSATQRTKHWSRRMDQSFIHVASAFLCYGSSGNVQYFLINLLYNLDCIRRQFRPIVRPKRNQMRIIISIIAYTLPLLKHGDLSTFVQLWTLFVISGYFFLQYPVGGWSHAVFHIVIAFVPPLLLRAATELPVSKEQLFYAASCAAMMNQ